MGRGCHYLRSKRTNPESPQRNQHKAQSQIDGFMHAQGAKEHVPGDAVHFGVKIGAKHQAAAVPGAFGGGVQQGIPTMTAARPSRQAIRANRFIFFCFVEMVPNGKGKASLFWAGNRPVFSKKVYQKRKRRSLSCRHRKSEKTKGKCLDISKRKWYHNVV